MGFFILKKGIKIYAAVEINFTNNLFATGSKVSSTGN
jgi:hypothetical protein